MKTEQQVKKHWYHTNNKILLKWIISGCFILLIPMICIIINFFYTKDLLTKKINESNRITLANTKYSLDTNLQSLLDISNYIILNNAFSNKALNAPRQELFLSKMLQCMQTLKSYKQINPAFDILIYFPNREFIVTPGTANIGKNIYDTLSNSFDFDQSITYESWKELLKTHEKNQFFIDSKYSYHNYGADSIVIATESPFIYKEQNKFNIYTSIPCSFIDKLLEDNQNSVLCILDKDGTILKQIGSKSSIQDNLGKISIKTDSDFGIVKFNSSGNSYVCSYEGSSVFDWYYAIYSPSSQYLRASIKLRNVSLFTMILTLLLGISSIIYLQYRNYRPLSKLVNRLPSYIKSDSNIKSTHNEFDLIETYYQVLYDENESMKTAIQTQQSYAKEVFLLSKLKGRRFHLSDSDVSEYLEWEQDNKKFAIASFYLDVNDEEMNAKHFDLISFSIDNVMNELFSSSYVYEKIIDEIFIVYIFIFDSNKEAKTLWESNCMAKFEQLYEFFRDKFQLDLSITVGKLFENFEKAPDFYNEILDAFAYRYVVEQYGVLSTQSLENMDFSFVEKLQNYRKELIHCVIKKDFDAAKLLIKELMEAIQQAAEPFLMVKYYLLSIISELLLLLRNNMDAPVLKENLELDNSVNTNNNTTTKQLELLLNQLSTSMSLNQTLCEFSSILMLLCGELAEQKEDVEEVLMDGDDKSPEDDSVILKIKNFIKEHYNDSNMNISMISDAIGLSPKYMSRLFKEGSQEGLLVYINMVRIKHAEKLLKNTNLTIDEIAEQTGFTNSRSFRRNFLKIVGMNPTEYRR